MALTKALAGMACLGAAFLGGAAAQWVMSGRSAYAHQEPPVATPATPQAATQVVRGD
jgi:hypothetical protein